MVSFFDFAFLERKPLGYGHLIYFYYLAGFAVLLFRTRIFRFLHNSIFFCFVFFEPQLEIAGWLTKVSNTGRNVKITNATRS